jgi:ribosomal protein S18 acetylase RimI-like enzyme
MALEEWCRGVRLARWRVIAQVRRSPFQIRKATGADAAGILECLHAAFGEYRADYTEGAYLDTVLTPESLGARLLRSKVFLAVDGMQQVVGTVGCSQADEQEGHIRGMAVRPEWQGAGVARQLLQRVEMELREQKCSRVSLDTTEPLQRAMRFYERNGYERSGKIADFFGMALIEYVKKL